MWDLQLSSFKSVFSYSVSVTVVSCILVFCFPTDGDWWWWRWRRRGGVLFCTGFAETKRGHCLAGSHTSETAGEIFSSRQTSECWQLCSGQSMMTEWSGSSSLSTSFLQLYLQNAEIFLYIYFHLLSALYWTYQLWASHWRYVILSGKVNAKENEKDEEMHFSTTFSII